MESIFMGYLQELIYLLLTIGIGFLIAYIKKCIGTEGIAKINAEIETKKELAETAVLFVQQVYKHYDGQEKYNEASIWLSAQLAEKGFKISDSEIRALIESALKQCKLVFEDQWYEKDIVKE